MAILVPLLVLFALLAGFQLALAIGAPWGSLAWGGSHTGRLPAKLRIASLVSALLFGVFAWWALERAGVSDVLPEPLGAVAGWVLFGVLVLSLLGNLASRSRLEKRVMAPVAAVLAVLALLLALGLGDADRASGSEAGEAGSASSSASEGPSNLASNSTSAQSLDGDADADADGSTALPDGFVDVGSLDPTIEAELRYASDNNFTGAVVDGYEGAHSIVLREDAARALVRVQADLADRGLGLRVYDAFRPTRAVADFVAWSASEDESTRADYYPDHRKPELFELGYIAEQSGHSLGGTVDLTLVDLARGEVLDMGGPFDFFGEVSHYESEAITAEQRANRAILHEAMLAQGFEQYPLEWWHFSFPVPDGAERLDFPVP